MVNKQHFEIIANGVDSWNSWRQQNRGITPDLSFSDLSGMILKGINLNSTDLRNVNLQGAILENAKLREVNLTEANISEAVLDRADLWGSKLIGANFQNANLNDAILWGAILTNSILTETRMARSDLRMVDLSGADLRRALLVGADLNRADLTEANLSSANLSNAYLYEANLFNAVLIQTKLTDADLTFATLDKANLSGTILSGCNMFRARFGGTTIGDVDLSGANNIDQTRHFSPSIVSISTIRKSNGIVPTTFLRGCGFSDLDIEMAQLTKQGMDRDEVTAIAYDLVNSYCGEGIVFYSCFISYSNKDEEFAKKLHDDLQNNGVRCWFAPEDMKIGDRIRVKIDQEIRLRDKLLVILSENSINSEWVGDEVEAAIEEEKETDKTILFPIRLDDAVLNTRHDWAAKIKRRRHIGDFSSWMYPSIYEDNLDRLLRDLKMHHST